MKKIILAASFFAAAQITAQTTISFETSEGYKPES